VSTVKFGGGEIMAWSCFSRVGLIPVKGHLASTIWTNTMLPTFWEQLGEGPFLFQHYCPSE